jgi:hypothetical protein
MEIDIATLLENHRRHMLAVVNEQEYDNEDELAASRFAVMSAHDRATTKALLDLYRTANSTQPVGNAAAPTPIATASRKVKAGSKKARDRAIKAGETRRRNLAARQGTQTDTPPATAINGGTASEGGAA